MAGHPAEGDTPPLRPRLRRTKADAHVSVRPAPVRIQLLTDPWSVWCWGFEPVRRTLELRYPSIEFEFLLGGMFPEMPDPDDVGFDLQRFFAVVQRTTGMPIRPVDLKGDRPKSTYPACVNVHAVRLVAPHKAGPYLRALREAVYLDGANVSRPNVGEALALRLGVDPVAFREALDSGRAEAAFDEALQALHAQGLHSYPTLLLEHRERAVQVEGFQTLPAVLGLAQSLSGRFHPPLPDPGLEQIVPEGERVATREVAEVLGVSLEGAYDRLARAEHDGLVRRQRGAAGDVWFRGEDPKAPMRVE